MAPHLSVVVTEGADYNVAGCSITLTQCQHILEEREKSKMNIQLIVDYTYEVCIYKKQKYVSNYLKELK